MAHEGMSMTPGSMSDGGMMHMSFYWGKDAIIFFSGWPEKSLGMYVLALCFVFLLGLAVEVLSVSPQLTAGGRSNSMLGVFVQACVYGVKMGFAYLVMLSVMSYNLGVFIVAVAGHTAGFFLVKARALAVANRADPMSSTTGINSKV
ncbi:hypothetical protein ACOSP7_029380 [Xanthoceras sorbifolium]|uniref:Copper transport protein n=1 Tax=Xanthoceras sorbifolium TaxID=99658 RepID=A0ABQ8HBB5_9ROSI|nr:hypothetical protein JRO89_XS12G0054000 [Xanthoceras sorbifolium]